MNGLAHPRVMLLQQRLVLMRYQRGGYDWTIDQVYPAIALTAPSGGGMGILGERDHILSRS